MYSVDTRRTTCRSGRKLFDSFFFFLLFIIFPLIFLTSSKTVMAVKKPLPASSIESITDSLRISTRDVESSRREEIVDYSNGKFATSIGYFIWFVVVAANIYAIVTLAMGDT